MSKPLKAADLNWEQGIIFDFGWPVQKSADCLKIL
jgi:hypothetical protein